MLLRSLVVLLPLMLAACRPSQAEDQNGGGASSERKRSTSPEVAEVDRADMSGAVAEGAEANDSTPDPSEDKHPPEKPVGAVLNQIYEGPTCFTALVVKGQRKQNATALFRLGQMEWQVVGRAAHHDCRYRGTPTNLKAECASEATPSEVLEVALAFLTPEGLEMIGLQGPVPPNAPHEAGHSIYSGKARWEHLTPGRDIDIRFLIDPTAGLVRSVFIGAPGWAWYQLVFLEQTTVEGSRRCPAPPPLR